MNREAEAQTTLHTNHWEVEMRIGVMAGAPGSRIAADDTVRGLTDWAQELESRGFSTLWLANILGMDAMSALTAVARHTERIELGTAVVATYSRHPITMAQQALTVSAASGGRFLLGVGLSHRFVIEDRYGLSYEKPVRHMREYLEIVRALLRGEAVEYEGQCFRVNAQLHVSGAKPVPLLVAALGEMMLKLAGRSADGTITLLTGEKTLEDHIVPLITGAAERAGRPRPRVVAGLPVVLTRNEDAVREHIDTAFHIYATVPSYRSMLEREGTTPGGVALVGDESALRARIRRLEEIGVDDLDAAVVPAEEGAAARTLDFLASLR